MECDGIILIISCNKFKEYYTSSLKSMVHQRKDITIGL